MHQGASPLNPCSCRGPLGPCPKPHSCREPWGCAPNPPSLMHRNEKSLFSPVHNAVDYSVLAQCTGSEALLHTNSANHTSYTLCSRIYFCIFLFAIFRKFTTPTTCHHMKFLDFLPYKTMFPMLL